MKPKEYIAKYSISQGWRGGIQNRFLEDMRAELNQACEDLKVDNLGAFNNAMKVVSAKWTSISNKIPYGIPEQLWNYFYATIVCPKREELCGKDMDQVREDKAKKSEAFEINKSSGVHRVFPFVYIRTSIHSARQGPMRPRSSVPPAAEASACQGCSLRLRLSTRSQAPFAAGAPNTSSPWFT